MSHQWIQSYDFHWIGCIIHVEIAEGDGFATESHLRPRPVFTVYGTSTFWMMAGDRLSSDCP